MRILAVATLVIAAACGSDSKPDPNAEVCDHYAKLARECAEDVPDNERAQLEIMSRDFCRKGMSGKHDEIFGEGYQKMIECTRNAGGCDAYRSCQDD